MNPFCRLLALLALTLFAAAPLAAASDFPEGNPHFETRLATAKTKAKQEGKPIVVVYSAFYCGPCQDMKKNVYPSAEVKAYHDRFIWAYIDITEEENEADVLKAGVDILPHLEFLDKNGRLLEKNVGYLTAGGLVAKLKTNLKKAQAEAKAAPAAKEKKAS